MKNKGCWIALGCSILLVIVLVVAGLVAVGAYGYSRAMGFSQRMTEASTAMADAQGTYRFDGRGFDAPHDAARYKDYLAVHDALAAAIASKAESPGAVNAIVAGRMPAIGFANLFTLWGEWADITIEAAAALDARAMSPQEFAYYHHATIRAVRAGADQGMPEMEQQWADLQAAATGIDTTISGIRQFNPKGAAPTSPQFNFQTFNGVTTYTYTGPPLPVMAEILAATESETSGETITGIVDGGAALPLDGTAMAVEAFLVSLTETHLQFPAP